MELIHANANLNEVDEVMESSTFMACLTYLQKCITTMNNVLGEVNKIYIAASRFPRAKEWQMKALSKIQNSTSIVKIDLCHVIQAKVWLLAGLHFTITYSYVLNMFFLLKQNGESCVFAAVARDCTELLGILIACQAAVNMTKVSIINWSYVNTIEQL